VLPAQRARFARSCSLHGPQDAAWHDAAIGRGGSCEQDAHHGLEEEHHEQPLLSSMTNLASHLPHPTQGRAGDRRANVGTSRPIPAWQAGREAKRCRFHRSSAGRTTPHAILDDVAQSCSSIAQFATCPPRTAVRYLRHGVERRHDRSRLTLAPAALLHTIVHTTALS
jgi:hypothetical protein